MKFESPRFQYFSDCGPVTCTHLTAIHIPLSAYPTRPFHRPANHKSVECYSDIISRPGLGKRKIAELDKCVCVCEVQCEDLHGGLVSSRNVFLSLPGGRLGATVLRDSVKVQLLSIHYIIHLLTDRI